jgi:hypothetical protein
MAPRGKMQVTESGELEQTLYMAEAVPGGYALGNR